MNRNEYLKQLARDWSTPFPIVLAVNDYFNEHDDIIEKYVKDKFEENYPAQLFEFEHNWDEWDALDLIWDCVES
jgi:hypothetical protein